MTELIQDGHVLPDVFPVVSAGEIAVPWPLPAVEELVYNVVKGSCSSGGPLADEMTVCVTLIDRIRDRSDLPITLLDPEHVLSGGCIVDVSELVPERSPVVSARGSAMPTSLPTISEVFSSAVLVGGGVVAAAAPLTEVGTVTARVSVLPDAGSELPVYSAEAAVVCSATADEAVYDALDVVGLHVGQLDGFGGCVAADG